MTDTQTMQTTINYLGGLRSELERNAEADTPHIPVFSYSGELVEYMNAHGITDPNDALNLISQTLDEILDERDRRREAVGEWPGSWGTVFSRWSDF